MPKVIITSKNNSVSETVMSENISEQEARELARRYNNFKLSNGSTEAVVRADGYEPRIVRIPS